MSIHQRKDFIEREIQRLTLFIANLTNKVCGLNCSNISIGLKEVSEALKSEFDLSLNEIIEREDSELLLKVSKLHESHLDKLINLLFQITKKTKEEEYEGLNFQKLTKKIAILINHLDSKSNEYSINRGEIRNRIQEYI